MLLWNISLYLHIKYLATIQKFTAILVLKQQLYIKSADILHLLFYKPDFENSPLNSPPYLVLKWSPDFLHIIFDKIKCICWIASFLKYFVFSLYLDNMLKYFISDKFFVGFYPINSPAFPCCSNGFRVEDTLNKCSRFCISTSLNAFGLSDAPAIGAPRYAFFSVMPSQNIFVPIKIYKLKCWI